MPKSALWLMPGGHIDPGETLLQTINREMKEELGVKDFFKTPPKPFWLSVTNIINDVRPCKKHFDVCHLVEVDATELAIDYTEYNKVRWLTIPEARKIITDPANLLALDAIETV